MAILLCDSWYPKGAVRKTVAKYKNLGLIANARVDTQLFELPSPRAGKRGRPAEKGRRLDIYKDFQFIRVEEYFVAVKLVLTNLFKATIYMTVTTPNLDNHISYRVFISTLTPETLSNQFKGYERKLSGSLAARTLWRLPLYLYSYRWPIDVFFYEMKTFWPFGLYRLRSKSGIESFVNFLIMAYACMKVPPLTDQQFSSLANESVQTAKYVVGEDVRRELLFCSFVSKSENGLNYQQLFDSFPCFNPYTDCSTLDSFSIDDGSVAS